MIQTRQYTNDYTEQSRQVQGLQHAGLIAMPAVLDHPRDIGTDRVMTVRQTEQALLQRRIVAPAPCDYLEVLDALSAAGYAIICDNGREIAYTD